MKNMVQITTTKIFLKGEGTTKKKKKGGEGSEVAKKKNNDHEMGFKLAPSVIIREYLTTRLLDTS